MITRRAVIDVGTNSIKLLVADVEGRRVEPVWEGSKQTRLGSGFYQTHRLQSAAIAKSARAVAEFAATARQRHSSSIRIIATSAARDALNVNDLTTAIEQAANLKVEVLSGEQEADLVFQGVTTDPALAHETLLLLDVGGGSTEFILGQGTHKYFSASVPLGSVRLMEELPHGNPPRGEELRACREWVKQYLEKEVQPGLKAALGRQSQTKPPVRNGSSALLLVGTGGAATILGRMEGQMNEYDRDRIEAARLTLEWVRGQVGYLWSLPLERRQQIIGLPAKRADIILFGAVIYEAVMELFHFSDLRISTRGLRFAAAL